MLGKWLWHFVKESDPLWKQIIVVKYGVIVTIVDKFGYKALLWLWIGVTCKIIREYMDHLLLHCAMEMELWNFVLMLGWDMLRTGIDMVEYWQRKPKIIPEFGVECSSFAVLCGTFGRRGTTNCWGAWGFCRDNKV